MESLRSTYVHNRKDLVDAVDDAISLAGLESSIHDLEARLREMQKTRERLDHLGRIDAGSGAEIEIKACGLGYLAALTGVIGNSTTDGYMVLENATILSGDGDWRFYTRHLELTEVNDFVYGSDGERMERPWTNPHSLVGNCSDMQGNDCGVIVVPVEGAPHFFGMI